MISRHRDYFYWLRGELLPSQIWFSFLVDSHRFMQFGVEGDRLLGAKNHNLSRVHSRRILRRDAVMGNHQVQKGLKVLHAGIFRHELSRLELVKENDSVFL